MTCWLSKRTRPSSVASQTNPCESCSVDVTVPCGKPSAVVRCSRMSGRTSGGVSADATDVVSRHPSKSRDNIGQLTPVPALYSLGIHDSMDAGDGPVLVGAVPLHHGTLLLHA